MRIYRRLPFGRLVEFYVLDTRQYRTDQPGGDRTGPPCDGVFDPAGTLLGRRQRDWLFRSLRRSPAQWNVLAQQIMMARVDHTPGEAVGYSMDKWPGYDVERRLRLRFLRDQKISNPIVLTGDIHSNWANRTDCRHRSNGFAVIEIGRRAHAVTARGNGTAHKFCGDGTQGLCGRRCTLLDIGLRQHPPEHRPAVKFYLQPTGDDSRIRVS
jgi:phosphodiesterase/alkaline phosphatase D-like protein